MTNLQRTLKLLSAAEITGEQTIIIDAALASANVDDISESESASVIAYIDTQLLHNTVSQEVRVALDRLQKQLRSREQRA